ncbi:MAG: hypothetical protein ABWK04_07110 [Hydrogenobacter sp.]
MTVLFVGLFIFAFVGYFVIKKRREHINYFEGLGNITLRGFIPFYTRGDLKEKDVSLSIKESRAGRYIKLEKDIKQRAFLRIKRRDLFDRILMQETYKGLSVEYEDEAWANRLFSHRDFDGVVEEIFYNLGAYSLEIREGKVSISFSFKKSPFEVEKERVLGATQVIKELINLINKLPEPNHYKDNLRSLLTLKLPIAITVLLSLIGIVGGFYKYDTLCHIEIFILGSKLLFPIALLYVGISTLLVGGKSLVQRVILKTAFVCFVCSFFISLFFLTYINGKFDTSEPQRKEDRIRSVYWHVKYGPKLLLDGLHSEKKWCDSFNISEDFYERAEPGDKVEYYTKRGFLGVEWLYRGIRLIKDRQAS